MDEQEVNRHLKKIINITNDGVILMVNRVLEEITGYSRNELFYSKS